MIIFDDFIYGTSDMIDSKILTFGTKVIYDSYAHELLETLSMKKKYCLEKDILSIYLIE